MDVSNSSKHAVLSRVVARLRPSRIALRLAAVAIVGTFCAAGSQSAWAASGSSRSMSEADYARQDAQDEEAEAASEAKAKKAAESAKVAEESTQNSAFKFEMTGIDGELKANVNARLATLNLANVTVRGRYRAQIRSAVEEGMRALGYYNPTLHFKWDAKQSDKTADDAKRTLRLTVEPGEPVKLEGVDIEIIGDAKEDRAFKLLLEKVPQKGDVLNHGVYDAFKSDLNNLAMARGYFDAKFIVSQLQVSKERNIGFWKIRYDSGRRYRFGKVSFHGNQIKEEYLQNLVPFEYGDNFSSNKLSRLNERLTNTGWFNSVVVAPEFKNVSEDKIIPLYGAVSPRVGNSVEVGAGFSTDVGPRFRSVWKKPWVNEDGHSLSVSTYLSSPEQTLDFTYKMPREENPAEEYYLVQGGFKRERLNDTDSDSATLLFSRNWDMERGWTRAVNLHWMLDKFTQGDTDNTTMLIYPGVSFSRTRARGNDMMPMWGEMQRYSIDVSSTFWGSDIDFVVFNAQGALIRSIERKHRFIMRGQFGWMQTNNFDKVPPDLRFFAGGDRSVRGYDYKSISPKDDNGDLIGAQRLLTGSLEYQYNVTGKWWGAVFIDVGEAVKKFDSTNFKTGAGFGIRWVSPIGPVKFDIARPIGDKDEKGVAFYIGIGPEI